MIKISEEEKGIVHLTEWETFRNDWGQRESETLCGKRITDPYERIGKVTCKKCLLKHKRFLKGEMEEREKWRRRNEPDS